MKCLGLWKGSSVMEYCNCGWSVMGERKIRFTVRSKHTDIATKQRCR